MPSALVVSMIRFAFALTPLHTFAGEPAEQAEARVARICEHIEAAALAPEEPPLARYGTDNKARERTALLLLSIASHETHLRLNVYEGRCRPWECDAGKAVGLWQLHARGGLAFDGLRYRAAAGQAQSWIAEHLGEIHQPAEFIYEPGVELGARMALHMLRTSIGLWATIGAALEDERQWTATGRIKVAPPRTAQRH